MNPHQREQRISWLESRLHTLQTAVLYSKNRKAARNEQARLQAELRELQTQPTFDLRTTDHAKPT